ncbi:MAG: hypothetical protein Q7S27_06930 [Nanoarchaeota archaeon]|nr:hypothetical protein [Nanoarchaeota archaeon]
MGDKKIFVFLGLVLIGIFLINGVLAQADICTEESAPLFTSSQKIYLNEPLNIAKTLLGEADLPKLLKRGKFSGNVEAEYSHIIEIGSNPKVVYAKQPTSSDDPSFGLKLSTSRGSNFYNATIVFNKAVDFTSSDSIGEKINLFGKNFVVSSETNSDRLVLYRDGLFIALTNTEPVKNVEIEGKEFSIELVSATASSATIKVTREGASDTKEVSEDSSKIIHGLIVNVKSADENNLAISANVIVGTEKITLPTFSGNSVTKGNDEILLEGTSVNMDGGSTANTRINIGIYAPNSDNDALTLIGKSPGENIFFDPIFGTFKVDFANFNIWVGSEERENIIVANKDDDKMSVTFTEHRGNEKNFQWAGSTTGNIIELVADIDGRRIHVVEGEKILRNELAVIGNEDESYLIKVSTVVNQTGTADDRVEFTDVFSGDVYRSSGVSTDGIASVVVGGKSYTVHYAGTSSDDFNSVIIDFPDSPQAGSFAIYPTIQTSKGAKVALYANRTLDVRITKELKFPNGNGYTDVKFTSKGNDVWNIAGGGINEDLNIRDYDDFVSINAGELKYRIKPGGYLNEIAVSIENPKNGNPINSAALIIFEERDDKGIYNGMVVTLEPGDTGDDGIGVDQILRTWTKDAEWDAITLASDNTKTNEADRWGTIGLIDSTDADQRKAVISYPAEQVFANIYLNSEVCSVVDEEPEENQCLRGDVNNDGEIDLSDVIYLLIYLFKGGPAPVACL